MTLREAYRQGFDSEVRWNERMVSRGIDCAYLPVPSRAYRAQRGVRFAFTIVREKVACRIAPWIVYPADGALSLRSATLDNPDGELRRLSFRRLLKPTR